MHAYIVTRYVCTLIYLSFYRSLEFLNDQHHGEDRVRLGRSYADNSDEDNESNEVDFSFLNVFSISE